MAKGPFLMPGADAKTEDWRDAVDGKAAPETPAPSADQRRRGCDTAGGKY